MDNHQNDRSDSSRSIFSQDLFIFEDQEEDIQSSFFYNLEDQNNVSAPMMAPGSTPAVQYGSVGPAIANQNLLQSTELMTNSSNAVGLDSNLVPHSIPNFSYPHLNETQQGHSHSFQAGLPISYGTGSFIQDQNAQMGYDQFSQVYNENFQQLQGMRMPYGNNMDNQMPMPYQARSFIPNHLEATQSGGQYFANQGYALVPPNQNPIMNTTQNYSSEYYDQTNNQYFAPNVSQYAHNYMLSPRNDSHMAPLFQTSSSSRMLNVSHPPFSEPIIPESMPRNGMLHSSGQLCYNYTSAFGSPRFTSEARQNTRLEQHNHNQLSAAAPSFWGSQNVPNMVSPQNQLLTTSVHQTTQGLEMLASSDSSQAQITIQPTFSPGDVTRQEPFPTLESSIVVHPNSSVQQNAYRPLMPADVAASVAAMRSSYGQHPYVVGGASNSVSSGSHATLMYPSLHGNHNIRHHFQASVPVGNIQHVAAPVQQQLPLSQSRSTQVIYNGEMPNARMSTLHSQSGTLHGPAASWHSQSAALHGPTMNGPTMSSLQPQNATLQGLAMSDLQPQSATLQSPAMSDLQPQSASFHGPTMSNLQPQSAILEGSTMTNLQPQNATLQGPTALPFNIPTSEELSSMILGHSVNGPTDGASSRPPRATRDEIEELLRKVETAEKSKQQQGAPATPRDGFTASQCDKGKLPASPSTGPPQKQQVQAPAAPRDGVHANQRDKGKLPQFPSTRPQTFQAIQRSTYLMNNQTAIPAPYSPTTQQNQQGVEINQNVVDLTNLGDREEPPVRRGRGRPPKQPGQSSNVSNLKKGDKDEAPKRPRGRPRRLPQQGESEEPPKYCGRGRPPKRFQHGADPPTLAKMQKTGESSFRSENAGASSTPQEEQMNCENMNEEDNANQVDSNVQSGKKYENAVYHRSSDWPLDPHLKKFKDLPDAGK